MGNETQSGRWVFYTPWGVFSIRPNDDGFAPFFEEENLGWYQTVSTALDDLVGGHTFTPSNGLDTSKAGLPDDLSEWTFVWSW